MKKRILSILLSAMMVLSLLPVTALAVDYADTVVYGSIYTAETEKPTAQAIAIKDGKYVYVGDEAGAAAYIQDGATQVIDHRGKGMVMPGCTDGHSHYTMKFGMDNMKGGIMFALEDDKAAILQKLDAATLAAKNAGKQSLFGFGWNYLSLTLNPLTSEELDAVTHGVSTIIFDQGGHHAFCNSECLRRCGIIDGEGNVLIKEIDGGLLQLDDNGYPTGYADERVTGFIMRKGGIDYDELVDDEVAETSIEKTQELLLSTGYTMALDGWSNMLHPSKLYAAANRLDKKGELKIVFPMTYEVEPWQSDAEMENEITYLDSLNKTYGTSHVLPQYLKLFMDGVVETKTGAMSKPYKDDNSTYESFWPVERLADITEKCNEKGLTVHVHAMGDAAIGETIDAYIQGGDGTHRNCMVHLRNVSAQDFQRLAENNIACSAGMTWHIDNGDEVNSYLEGYLENDYVYHAYPIKSFFDAGVKVSSHSDFPANIPCPQDPFGIMEVAVTGTIPDPSTGEMLSAYDEDELVTVEQAFQALTINGAWQLGLENERGSIKVGKWADFVLADKDVFTCEAADIGETKVVSTWFEGEKVYPEPGSEENPWQIGKTDTDSGDGNSVKVSATVSGSTATVILPYEIKDGTVPENYSVYYVAEDGTTEKADAAYDMELKAFVIEIEHFSVYAVAYSDTCLQDESCVYAKFTDADTEAWYHDGVHYCVENGLMNGVADGAFAPNATLSRGMIVTILWRMEGEPVANYAMSFEDVKADQWYTEAIRWAAAEKIVNGYDTEYFAPDDDVTREQLATILYRYAQSKGEGFTGSWMFLLDFVDRGDISSWADEAVHWCSMKGIVGGKDGKVFDPQGNATRAESATMIQRFCELAEK